MVARQSLRLSELSQVTCSLEPWSSVRHMRTALAAVFAITAVTLSAPAQTEIYRPVFDMPLVKQRLRQANYKT